MTSTNNYHLAFETSSAIGAVALGLGPDVLQTIAFSAPRKHASEFLPTIHTLCLNANITPQEVATIFVSIGPGSFTGLRIAVTAARFIAYATGANLIAVPTLNIIAQNALDADPRPQQLAVLLDAKRQHVFTATFILQNNAYIATCQTHEADPLTFLKKLDPSTILLGEGIQYHTNVIQASGLTVLPDQHWPPSATTLYHLGYAMALQGKFTDFHALLPHYIRPPEAQEKWQQRFDEKQAKANQ